MQCRIISRILVKVKLGSEKTANAERTSHASSLISANKGSSWAHGPNICIKNMNGKDCDEKKTAGDRTPIGQQYRVVGTRRRANDEYLKTGEPHYTVEGIGGCRSFIFAISIAAAARCETVTYAPPTSSSLRPGGTEGVDAPVGIRGNSSKDPSSSS